MREIQWYKAQRKRKNILAYGYLTEREKDFLSINAQPTEPENLKKFKLESSEPYVTAYRKKGKKFILIDNFPNELEARKGCLKVLRQVGIWCILGVSA